MDAQRWQGILYAFLAALCFTFSPVLTRIATASLSTAEITFVRLGVGGTAVMLIAIFTQDQFPRRRQLSLYGLLGLGLALHFIFYVAAIRFTTLAHAITIIYASILVIALLSRFVLGESLSLLQWGGILISLIGLALLTGFEPLMDRRMIWGDLLAFGSAITFGIYTLMGRHQRKNVGLFAYGGTIFLLAALFTLPFAVASFNPEGYTVPALLSAVASGLVPMGVGHTLYNAALRLTSATTVNLISMQEVVVAVAAGMVLFHETPALLTLAGIGLTMGGVALVVAAVGPSPGLRGKPK